MPLYTVYNWKNWLCCKGHICRIISENKCHSIEYDKPSVPTKDTYIISIWNQCLQAFLGKLFGVPCCTLGLPCGSAGKESACNAGDLSLIPGLGRSPGEGKSYPLQYSGLENSMDCIVHGIAKSQAWLLYIESRCCTLFQHYRQERSMTSRKRKEKFAHICSYRCETWFKWTSDF